MKTFRRHIFLLFFCFLCHLYGFAQFDFVSAEMAGYGPYMVDTSKVDTSTAYLFTKEDAATDKPAYADYYRLYKIIHERPRVFRIKEYWMDGTLKRSYTTQGASFFNRVGEYNEYNRKGELIFYTYYDKQADVYGINHEIGPRVLYYDNGIKKEVAEIADRRLQIVSFWDSTGAQTVADGNGEISYRAKMRDGETYFNYVGEIKDYHMDGIWTGGYLDGKIYCRDTYKDGTLVKGMSYDSLDKEYKYNVIFENNTAEQISNKLVEQILYNLPYKAKRIGTYWMGNDVPVLTLKLAYVCHVEIDIDGKGVIADVRILKGIDEKTDAEIVYAIRFIKKIRPFIYRGQPTGGHYVVSLALPH